MLHLFNSHVLRVPFFLVLLVSSSQLQSTAFSQAVKNEDHDKILQLRHDLKSKDISRRMKAIVELGSFGSKAALAAPDLLELSFGDDIPTKIAALDSLEEIGPAAFPVYAKVLLEGPKNHQVGLLESLARVLYQVGHPPLDEAISKCLLNEDFNVRRAAIGVVRMGHRIPKAIAVIASSGLEDRAWDAQFGDVFEALEKAGPDASAALPRLMQLFKDSEFPNCRRQFAIGALVEIGKNDDACFALLRQLAKDPNQFITVREKAVYGLGTSKHGQRAMADFVELLADKKPANQKLSAKAWLEFRCSIVRAMANLEPDSKALPELVAILKADDWDAKRWTWRPTIITLGKIGPDAKGAIPSLLSLMKDREMVAIGFPVDEFAIALNRIVGRKQAIEMMTDFAGDLEARRIASRVIGKLNEMP